MHISMQENPTDGIKTKKPTSQKNITHEKNDNHHSSYIGFHHIMQDSHNNTKQTKTE